MPRKVFFNKQKRFIDTMYRYPGYYVTQTTAMPYTENIYNMYNNTDTITATKTKSNSKSFIRTLKSLMCRKQRVSPWWTPVDVQKPVQPSNRYVPQTSQFPFQYPTQQLLPPRVILEPSAPRLSEIDRYQNEQYLFRYM